MAASSGLVTPPRTKPTSQSFDTRPKAVEQWLRELPVANLGETSRRLYHALREVNGLQLPAARRFTFLEDIRATHRYVIEGLRKNYLHRDLPLPEKNRRVAQLAMALLHEAALGYQIVIEDSGGMTRRRRGISFHRAIKHLSAMLVEGFLIYEPSPQGVWQKLHMLYAMAKEQHLGGFACEHDHLTPELERSTVDDAYKQTLLTTATGPFRMPQGEALRIYQLMEVLAPAARLLPVDHPKAAGSLFVVDLDSDRGPQFREDAQTGPSALAIQTDKVLEALSDGFAPRPRKGLFRRRKPLTADTGLQERVTLALGEKPQRRHSRQPASSSIQIVLGLSHINRLLAEELGIELDTGGNGDSRFISRDVESPRSETNDDVWQLIYRPGPELAEKTQNQPAFTSREQRGDEQTKAQWQLVNISAGGYCLLSDSNQTARAHVGELVALRELNAKEMPWQTGVIRWMKFTVETGMQLGVQVMAPNPRPVLIRPRKGDGKNRIDRGLTLPPVRPTGQPATLITPPLRYAVDTEIVVKGHTNSEEVRLMREMDRTRSFSQFVYHGARHPHDTDHPFDSVFDSI